MIVVGRMSCVGKIYEKLEQKIEELRQLYEEAQENRGSAMEESASGQPESADVTRVSSFTGQLDPDT